MSAHRSQMTLDLGHRPAFGRDEFWVADSNKEAVSWIDLWPKWDAPAFLLYGPAASGKSHLLSVWQAKADAKHLSARQIFDDPTCLHLLQGGEGPKTIALERVDLLVGDKACETALFHLYNALKEQGGSMMLTSSAPAAQLAFVLPDLASRLRAAPSAGLKPPSDDLLAAVMAKQFNDRQVKVGEDVVRYLIPRMERSLAAVRDLVAEIDQASLVLKKPVTIPLVRDILLKEYQSE